MSSVYYDNWETPWGSMQAAFYGKGLIYMSLPGGDSDNDLQSWVLRKIPKASLIKEAAPFQEVQLQLAEYLLGQRREFDLPLNMYGTEFQKKVWEALRTIPFGETRTYGDIARQVDNPKGVRAVGGANNKNPIPIIIPCHRVIGSNGQLVGFGGGLDLKQRLLDLEQKSKVQNYIGNRPVTEVKEESM